MARWLLKQKHYIPIQDTEWEHKETNRDTGKPIRKVFTVPRFLDPENPDDYTHREQNAIIVCYEGKGDRRDLVFSGEPTPDMEPLDEEARAISDSVAKRWIDPMGEAALPGQGGYAEALQQGFLKEIAAIMAGQKPSGPVSAPADLTADVEALKAQIAELSAMLKAKDEVPAETKAKPTQPERRV